MSDKQKLIELCKALDAFPSSGLGDIQPSVGDFMVSNYALFAFFRSGDHTRDFSYEMVFRHKGLSGYYQELGTVKVIGDHYECYRSE